MGQFKAFELRVFHDLCFLALSKGLRQVRLDPEWGFDHTRQTWAPVAESIERLHTMRLLSRYRIVGERLMFRLSRYGVEKGLSLNYDVLCPPFRNFDLKLATDRIRMKLHNGIHNGRKITDEERDRMIQQLRALNPERKTLALIEASGEGSSAYDNSMWRWDDEQKKFIMTIPDRPAVTRTPRAPGEPSTVVCAADVDSLKQQLASATNPADKRKIRQKLRKLGHRGGLKA